MVKDFGQIVKFELKIWLVCLFVFEEHNISVLFSPLSVRFVANFV